MDAIVIPATAGIQFMQPRMKARSGEIREFMQGSCRLRAVYGLTRGWATRVRNWRFPVGSRSALDVYRMAPFHFCSLQETIKCRLHLKPRAVPAFARIT